MLWAIEVLVLKRIDSWGLGFILGALALITHGSLNDQSGLLLLVIAAVCWLGCWLNDYYDASFDRCDAAKARLNLFARHAVPPALVWAPVGLILTATTLALASFGWRGWLVLLVNLLLMWSYSAQPLRLKSRPGLDLLFHALFAQPWLYWICLWVAGAAWTALDQIVVCLLFLTSLSGQLNQQIRDFELDSRTDVNFTTRFGLAKALRLLKLSSSAAVLLALAGLALGAIPWSFFPLCLLGLPKLAHHLRYTRRNVSRAYPPWMIYVSMLLALAYTGVLMVASWPL